jgi:hypothetical protein
MEYSDVFENDRVAELFEPLLAVAPDEARENLIEIGREIEEEQIEEDASSIEADVLDGLFRQYVEDRDRSLGREPLSDGWPLLIGEVSAKINEERSEKDRLSNERIGRVLTRLGFKKARLAGGPRQRGYQWNSRLAFEQAERYCPNAIEKYDLQPKEPSLPSLLSSDQEKLDKDGPVGTGGTDLKHEGKDQSSSESDHIGV